MNTQSRTLGKTTAQLVEALSCIMKAEECTLSYFVEIYGEEDGHKGFQENGFKTTFIDAKALLKERIGDAIEISLAGLNETKENEV